MQTAASQLRHTLCCQSVVKQAYPGHCNHLNRPHLGLHNSPVYYCIKNLVSSAEVSSVFDVVNPTSRVYNTSVKTTVHQSQLTTRLYQYRVVSSNHSSVAVYFLFNMADVFDLVHRRARSRHSEKPTWILLFFFLFLQKRSSPTVVSRHLETLPQEIDAAMYPTFL